MFQMNKKAVSYDVNHKKQLFSYTQLLWKCTKINLL